MTPGLGMLRDAKGNEIKGVPCGCKRFRERGRFMIFLHSLFTGEKAIFGTRIREGVRVCKEWFARKA